MATLSPRPSSFQIVDTRSDEASPSDYISHGPSRLASGTRVVLYCRVSTVQQEQSGGLAHQVADMLEQARSLGLLVVAVYYHVWPGWHPDRLDEAVALAKQHDAVLLAPATDRFVRNAAFWKSKQQARPVKHDFVRLMLHADGVPLFTLLDPDAPPAIVASARISRGQRWSGRKGGRPRLKKPGYKKLRRVKNLQQVQELLKGGVTIRDIAHSLKLPVSTVGRWAKGRKGSNAPAGSM